MGALRCLKCGLLSLLAASSLAAMASGWSKPQSSSGQRLAVASSLLCLLYSLLAFELTDRTLAALLVAGLSVACHALLVGPVELEELLQWLDLDTLALLLGMMLVAGELARSGLFDWMAIWCYKRARGRLWPLISSLLVATGLLSALLDNVTTMLLVAPTLLRLARLEQLDGRLLLVAACVASNIGGLATPAGDPPNLIIMNSELSARLGLSFGSFMAYCAPGACLSLLTMLAYLRFAYPNRASMGRVQTLAASSASAEPADEQVSARAAIRSVPALALGLLALLAAVSLFLVAPLLPGRLSLGWLSLMVALWLLAAGSEFTDPRAPTGSATERALASVEWPTLVFFAALFVVVHVLQALGLVAYLADQLAALVGALPAGQWRQAAALSSVLWGSAVASACLDNVPFTAMMVQVLAELAHQDSLQLTSGDQRALLVALAYGATLGGNATLVGSSANLVTVGVAARHGQPISFGRFMALGLPVTLVSLVATNLYLVLVFGWL